MSGEVENWTLVLFFATASGVWNCATLAGYSSKDEAEIAGEGALTNDGVESIQFKCIGFRVYRVR